jgi:hypothetical protein
MNKFYLVESELCPRCYFDNESDRNEMALALWQEQVYFLWARTVNWYEDGIMVGIEEDAASNVFTWECQTWFDVPTQVAWFEDNHYNAGIAYEDYVICACCGGVTEIDEIVDFAPSGVEPIVVYDEWVNLHEEIIDNEEADYLYDEEDK